jgi:glycosyltransferase involved in cell wall biosynthesis
LTRQDVVVCITDGDAELRTRTLSSVRAHTDSTVTVTESDTGLEAFAAAAPADVVLLEPGCVVAAGWLERLGEAARSTSTIATATAISQRDLSLGDVPLEHAADAIASGSLRLRPRLGPSGMGGACVYVRRSALELVGGGEDFWPRCLERGLSHVLADDVLVLDPGSPGIATSPSSGPVARALGAAQRALRGLSVLIDARILYGPMTGSHVHVLELIAALSRTQQLRLTAMVPDKPNEDALARLRSLPGLTLVGYRDARGGADIVHRPFQLTNAGDLTFLESLRGRLIVTHQDLIAFHNPSYFPSAAAWEGYRELTRLTLSAADRVVFFSAHVRDDSLAEELVDSDRASVVHLGVDHPLLPLDAVREPVAPAGADALATGATPAILCLGTDFHHKNRVFALRLLERLRCRHGWNGVLVFAGSSVAHGSSRPQEARFLSEHPGLAKSVLELGAVTEAEKEWLFARATLVVYPSVLEGFGLVPFEAAAHRVPCLWAPGSSLSELLPDDAAEIVPWDEEATAQHALALMRDDDAAEANVAAINAATAGLTWDATAAGLVEVYRTTADAPARTQRRRGFILSEDAARLVGPAGDLPADVHRPLLALATHPRIARPVFRALKLGYRASNRLNQARKHR